MAGKFVLKRSGDQFMFNLVAGNGQIVLTSERYTSKDGALNGISSVQTNAGNEGRYEATESGLKFNLKAANGQIRSLAAARLTAVPTPPPQAWTP